MSKQVDCGVKILGFTKYSNSFKNTRLSQLKLFYQKKKKEKEKKKNINIIFLDTYYLVIKTSFNMV